MQSKLRPSFARLKECALVTLTLLASSSVHAGPKDPFRYEQLFEIDQIVDAQIAPDGSQVAVVTERRKAETYFGRQRTLWLVSRKGSTPYRVAAPDTAASLEGPVWAPDGQRLIYRVTRDKKTELAMLDLPSKQTRSLQPCRDKETVGTVVWSPDGARIAAICSGPSPMDPVVAAAESKEQKAKGDLDSKRIIATRSRYYDSDQFKPWSPARRAILTSLDGTQPVEIFSSQNLLDEPGTLQWKETGTLWLVGTPSNAFGGMPFANGRAIYRYNLAEGKLSKEGDVPVTERMPLLTGPGSRFVVPSLGTVGSSNPEKFRRTWELDALEIHEFSNGKLTKESIGKQEIFVGRSAPFVWVSDQNSSAASGTLYFQWFDRGSNRIHWPLYKPYKSIGFLCV